MILSSCVSELVPSIGLIQTHGQQGKELHCHFLELEIHWMALKNAVIEMG